MAKINNLVAKFQNDAELAKWGTALQTHMPSIEGEKLPPPSIKEGTRKIDDFYNRRERHLQPL